MQGFDSEFTDIVDYILRITERIWEGRQVELCRQYYSDDCPVYTLAGYTHGAEVVTQNTWRTLEGFPDRTLHADNIIWGGNAEDGFHTSHLIYSEMTNLGPSEFGNATGKRGKIHVIAHCVCKDNRVIEEWLVRDNYLLATQLGTDPIAYAKEQAQKPLAADSTFALWLGSEHQRVSQQHRKPTAYPANQTQASDTESFITAALHNIWNARQLEDTNILYAQNACLHASARSDCEGIVSISQFYADILGSISDAKVTFDYVCSNSMLTSDTRIAVRWTLAGSHDGDALWGKATKTPLLILGESQYRVVDGQVMEEWLVFDELAVLTQVERARLAQGAK